ncbi:hypothetical protein OV320_0133 [Actinobacteria bacterium OV320]|nr:hypothetical protein OV320_0133 [Actinobacteria bacterium OV320]
MPSRRRNQKARTLPHARCSSPRTTQRSPVAQGSAHSTGLRTGSALARSRTYTGARFRRVANSARGSSSGHVHVHGSRMSSGLVRGYADDEVSRPRARSCGHWNRILHRRPPDQTPEPEARPHPVPGTTAFCTAGPPWPPRRGRELLAARRRSTGGSATAASQRARHGCAALASRSCGSSASCARHGSAPRAPPGSPGDRPPTPGCAARSPAPAAARTVPRRGPGGSDGSRGRISSSHAVRCCGRRFTAAALVSRAPAARAEARDVLDDDSDVIPLADHGLQICGSGGTGQSRRLSPTRAPSRYTRAAGTRQRTPLAGRVVAA